MTRMITTSLSSSSSSSDDEDDDSLYHRRHRQLQVPRRQRFLSLLRPSSSSSSLPIPLLSFPLYLLSLIAAITILGPITVLPSSSSSSSVIVVKAFSFSTPFSKSSSLSSTTTISVQQQQQQYFSSFSSSSPTSAIVPSSISSSRLYSSSSSNTKTRELGSQENLMLPRQYGVKSNNAVFPSMNHISVALLNQIPTENAVRYAITECMKAHPLLRAHIEGNGEPDKRIDLFQMVREGDNNPCTFVASDDDKSKFGYTSDDVLKIIDIDVDDDDDDDDVGAVNGVVVASLESDVLWMSLFGDNFVGIDDNTKAMLEALVNGGALKREANEINSLKVFVDMYHKHTFEQIVQSIKFLKGLQSLVICRGLDQTRPTYRSVQEIKSLLDATGSIEQLDSLMLLNFTSDSLTNLAIVIHQQPSIYRLQIQLVEGTLNGEILGVMATAPRLTFVMLELKESCSLGMLMNSKSIQSLRVNSNNLVLKKNHVQTLVCSLQSNFTLTSLDLAPSISIEIFRSLCTTLKQNYRLESLRVNLDLKTVDESGIAALELANLFRENNMLINVWNYSYQVCPVSDTSKRVVISALRNNKSMVNFKFFSEDIDDWKYNMNEDPKTVRLKSDTSVSLLSGADNSIATKSLLEDELSEFADMIDSSTFPIPCDCVTMRNIGNDYYNWACATTKNVQRMEV